MPIIIDENKIFCPKNRKGWREWLNKNSQTESNIWLKFFKKVSIKHNLTYQEARDEAICFGWIDSTVKRIDEEIYMQYFSKRREKSYWSDFNKKIVEKLISEGLMTEFGLKAIEKSKNIGHY